MSARKAYINGCFDKKKKKKEHAGVYHRATVGVYPRWGTTAVKFAEPEKNIQQQVMLRGHYTSE